MHDLERTDKRRQFEDSSGEHEEMLSLGDHIGNYRMLIDIAHNPQRHSKAAVRSRAKMLLAVMTAFSPELRHDVSRSCLVAQ